MRAEDSLRSLKAVIKEEAKAKPARLREIIINANGENESN